MLSCYMQQSGQHVALGLSRQHTVTDPVGALVAGVGAVLPHAAQPGALRQ
jgi:hypothetical protein